MQPNFDILELIKGNCRFYLGDHVDISFVVHQDEGPTHVRTVSVLKTEDEKRERLFFASGSDLHGIFMMLLQSSSKAAERHIVSHGYQSRPNKDSSSSAKVKEGEGNKKHSKKDKKRNHFVLSDSSESEWTTSDESDADSSDASSASSSSAASRRHGKGRATPKPIRNLSKPFFDHTTSITGVNPAPGWLPGNAATVQAPPLPPHLRCAGPPVPPTVMIPPQLRTATFTLKSEKYGQLNSIENCTMNIGAVRDQAREILQERFMDFSYAPDVAPSKKKIDKLSLTVDSVKVGNMNYGIGKGVVSLGAAVPLGMPHKSVTFVIKVEKKDVLVD